MAYKPKFLLELFRTMLRIRECEEALVAPIISGEIITPCHLTTGQEAVATGIMACLNTCDNIFGNHRSHGHYIAKTGDIRQMMAEVFCRESGCSKGRGGSMHLVCPEKGMLGSAPIVGGTVPLALGAALAAHIRGNKRVTATFFGDGATGEGGVYESLNFSSLLGLPLLFVCENNLYATHMPIRACRNNNNISLIAKPFGIKTWRVDGNDVLKVYEAAKAAVALCRAGKGPAFIECLTYRYRGHVGPNDNIQGTQTDIRPEPEIKRWRTKDPIMCFERKIIASRMISPRTLESIKADVRAEVHDAVIFARRSSRPAPSGLKKYVAK